MNEYCGVPRWQGLAPSIGVRLPVKHHMSGHGASTVRFGAPHCSTEAMKWGEGRCISQAFRALHHGRFGEARCIIVAGPAHPFDAMIVAPESGQTRIDDKLATIPMPNKYLLHMNTNRPTFAAGLSAGPFEIRARAAFATPHPPALHPELDAETLQRFADAMTVPASLDDGPPSITQRSGRLF